LESEVDRRKTCETWRVPFMDANQLAAAGFYFTNQSYIVRCFLWSGNRLLDGWRRWLVGTSALESMLQFR